MAETADRGRRWYEVKAKTDDRAEVWIYDEIGLYGVSAKEFARELKAVKAKKLDVRINSPGGSVFDGAAVFNALRRHSAQVTTYVDGLAASIASVIALAGERVVMAENALFMVHNPWTLAMGDAAEMRKAAEMLDKVRDTILGAYRDKTGMDDAALMALMDDETWMNAEEALAAGFVDEVDGALDLAASAQRFDLAKYGFKRPPQALGASADAGDSNPPEPRGSEPQTAKTEPTQPDAAEPAAHPSQATPKAADKEIVMSETIAAPAGATPQSISAEIVRLCVAHGCADQAAEWIAAGKTVEDVARTILGKKTTAPSPQPAAEAVDLSPGEQQRYSLCRAILGAANGRLDGLEREVSDEIFKKLPGGYKTQGGFFVPLNLRNPKGREVRALGLDSTTSTAGAELVFERAGEFIDLLRNASWVVRRGARVLSGLTSPVSFPRQTGAGTASWTSENPGSDVSDTDMTLDTVPLAPKTLQSSTSYSKQLLVQGVEDVETMIRNDLAAIHALAWDRAALHGTGADNQPEGIYYLDGVNSITVGGVPEHADLVDMVTECAKDNAIMGALGWLTTPGMAGALMKTPVVDGTDSTMLWQGTILEGRLVGYPAAATNQVSATLGTGADHGMVFGNWADLLIGMWGALEIIVDPYAKKKQGMIELTSFQMVDIAIRHPESFCKALTAGISA